MNWEVIITALITAAGMYLFPELGKVLAARLGKTPQERREENKNLSAKTEGEIVRAANDLVAGSAAASKVVAENLLRSIEYLKLELTEARAENSKLETEIDTIKISREEARVQLKAQAIESKDTLIENAELKKQVNKLEVMFVKMGKYIDTQNEDMRKAGIPVTQNGELMDSVRRLQLSIEQRERLKAGK